MAKTWRELEAEGVKRCCATFTSGKRCRRRAAEDSSWCQKHQWVARSIQNIHNAAMEAQRKQMEQDSRNRNQDPDDWDDDDGEG